MLRKSGEPARSSATERLAAAITAAACLALLIVGARLTPNPAGYGTHTQLAIAGSRVGLQPCVWASLMGFPCATCGMTTAFAHAADGDLPSAFRVQPMGGALAVLTATVFWLAAHQAAFGSRIGRLAGVLMGRWTLWIGLAGLGAAWVYKIMTWETG